MPYCLFSKVTIFHFSGSKWLQCFNQFDITLFFSRSVWWPKTSKAEVHVLSVAGDGMGHPGTPIAVAGHYCCPCTMQIHERKCAYILSGYDRVAIVSNHFEGLWNTPHWPTNWILLIHGSSIAKDGWSKQAATLQASACSRQLATVGKATPLWWCLFSCLHLRMARAQFLTLACAVHSRQHYCNVLDPSKCTFQ